MLSVRGGGTWDAWHRSVVTDTVGRGSVSGWRPDLGVGLLDHLFEFLDLTARCRLLLRVGLVGFGWCGIGSHNDEVPAPR